MRRYEQISGTLFALIAAAQLIRSIVIGVEVEPTYTRLSDRACPLVVSFRKPPNC